MKIGISTLVTPVQKSGVSNYIINLIESLQRIDRENEYYIFAGRDTRHFFDFKEDNFKLIVLPFSHDPRWLMRPLYFLWQNSLVYRYIRRYGIEVFHLPNIMPLFIQYIPTVITVHDLAEHWVKKYSGSRQYYRKRIVSISSNKASRIIAVSESTKRDLTNIAGTPPDKIDVTYEAGTLGPIRFEENVDSVLRPYCIQGEYILFVGKFLPHKNVARIIEAFTRLKREHDIPQRLVMVGKQDKHTASFMQLAENLGIRDEIILTGYVPDEELPYFYKGASLFVFPSLYEGFGLPVIDAMSCGIPVITSNVSSLPEVAGDAAILVDPLSTDAIAEGMWLVLNDEKKHEKLSRKGKERARQFTWERCAWETLATYRKALDQV